MLKKFISYYKPHWKLFTLDMSAALIHALALLVIPMYVRSLLNLSPQAEPLTSILTTLIILFLLVIIASVMIYLTTRYGHGLGVKIETDMRRKLFAHLQKLSFRYYDNTKTGHIMSRISNDLFTISEIAHHAPESLFISFCMIFGGYYFMFSFNWRLAIFSAVPTVILLAWGFYFGGRLRGGFREVRKKIADINSSVENSIQGIREVKSYTGEEAQIDKFAGVNLSFKAAKEGMYRMLALFHSVMVFMTTSHDFIVIAGGIILKHYGLVTMSDLVAFLLYNRFIGMPIRMLIHFSEQFQQGAAAFERYTEIMDIEPELTDASHAVELSDIAGKIEFKNVGFKYDAGSSEWILDNVSFTVPAGATFALVGESGAGKSTLAALIPRFYDVDSGDIEIDSQNVKNITQQSLRRAVGIVQQSSFIFDFSIRENILIGKPSASDEEVIEAAKNANIWDFIASLPDGLDSQVGEQGVKLSGGQKQRIAIARAYLKNPPVLIFDEATSSLDSESESLVQESMEQLCAGRTTIIIAHRLSTVKNADYIIVLRHGKVIEQGKHTELIAAGGYYKNLYERHIF